MDVRDFVFQTVAEAFGKDVAEIAGDTRFIEDLGASSVNYFPVINALEGEYDLDIQYQEFRRECPTVADAVAYVEEQI